MNIQTRNTIQIVVVVSLTVLAIIGVIYGVSTHKEAGLMTVCWEGGQAYYDYSCEGQEELRWDRNRIPLDVSSSENTEVRAAVDEVNNQIGCEILRFTPNLGSDAADVLIETDGALGTSLTSSGGITSHTQISEVGMQAHVSIMGVTDPHYRVRVLVHELGHVLGLDHDDFKASIMYPTMTITANMQLTRFTNHDRNLLREIYCP